MKTRSTRIAIASGITLVLVAIAAIALSTRHASERDATARADRTMGAMQTMGGESSATPAPQDAQHPPTASQAASAASTASAASSASAASTASAASDNPSAQTPAATSSSPAGSSAPTAPSRSPAGSPAPTASTPAPAPTAAALPKGFVYVADLVPDAILDMRYAGTDNFIGRPIAGYEAPVAILSREAAEALARVVDALSSEGLTVKIYDAYRPQTAVDDFFAWASDPGDQVNKARYYPDTDKTRLHELGFIAKKSGHTRGSTIDLTLCTLDDGVELDMGSPFDFFGKISYHDTKLVDADALRNRNTLRDAMRKGGFEPYAKEWWHYKLASEPFPDTYFSFPVR